MQKNLYINCLIIFFVAGTFNYIVAMEPTTPLKVPTSQDEEGESSSKYSDVPPHPIKKDAEERNKQREAKRAQLNSMWNLNLENPVRSSHKTYSTPKLTPYNPMPIPFVQKDEPDKDEEPILSDSENPSPSDPGKPNRPGKKDKPLLLEELKELGITEDQLCDEELIDILKLNFPTQSSLHLSSAEDKAREQAMIGTYGTVADILQQRKLSHVINRIKVNNENEQAQLLRDSNFPEIQGILAARKEFAQNQIQNKQMLTRQYWTSLARHGVERGFIACGEFLALTFCRNIIEPGMAWSGRSIYELVTQEGRKQKITRQYINNNEKMKEADTLIAMAEGQLNYEKQQRQIDQKRLQKYSSKLKSETDPILQKKYEEKTKLIAADLATSKFARKEARRTKREEIAEKRKHHQIANELARKRRGKSKSQDNEERAKLAQTIAQQYLTPPAPVVKEQQTKPKPPASYSFAPTPEFLDNTTDIK